MDGLRWFVGFLMAYVAVAVLVIGVVGRALRWRLMPRHLPWTLYPPPDGLSGQLRFMAGEIFTFRAVYHQNQPLWIGAWLFHVAMALVVLSLALFALTGGFIWLSKLSFILLGLTAAYLIAYRRLVAPARAISHPIEFFNLGLFLAIGLAGAATALSYDSAPHILREYLFGLVSFRSEAVPESGLFLLFVLLVEIFFVYFPFSRMIHMVSKYFAFHTVNWEHKASH